MAVGLEHNFATAQYSIYHNMTDAYIVFTNYN